MIKPLTQRQMVVLEHVKEFASEHRRGPTVQELAAILQRANNTVQEMITTLIGKGYLTRTPGEYRSLKVVPEERKKRPAVTGYKIPTYDWDAGGPFDTKQFVEAELDPVLFALPTKGTFFAVRICSYEETELKLRVGTCVILRKYEQQRPTLNERWAFVTYQGRSMFRKLTIHYENPDPARLEKKLHAHEAVLKRRVFGKPYAVNCDLADLIIHGLVEAIIGSVNIDLGDLRQRRAPHRISPNSPHKRRT